jgi:hypothetical protein
MAASDQARGAPVTAGCDAEANPPRAANKKPDHPPDQLGRAVRIPSGGSSDHTKTPAQAEAEAMTDDGYY